MLRYRGPKDTFKELDAFPKLPEKYVEKTKIGGTLSLLSRILIGYFVFTEVKYYLDSRLVFKFTPDTDLDAKLKIHMDITVATPCRGIGADILDATNQNTFSFGILQEDDTWWTLCPEQQLHFDYMQHLNGYLREEYHSVAEILYKSNQMVSYDLPPCAEKPNRPHDACRIHGDLTLNKVAGNFHITAGKSIHLSQGHIHISSMFDDNKQNFSHRINRLSFGESTAGIVHPLEGDEKILTDGTVLIQYFLEIVPTDVQLMLSHSQTFQYSVKESARPIDHNKGSHGTPGIYFKYDVSALKITVRENRENIVHFIIRLCSIIAGIVVISGFITKFFQTINTWLFCQRSSHAASDSNISYKHFKSPQSGATMAAAAAATPKLIENKLLQNANAVTEVPFSFTITK